MQRLLSTTIFQDSYVHEILLCGTKGRLVAKGADLFGQKHDMAKEELIHHDVSNILDESKTGVSESIRAHIPIIYLKGLIRLINAVKDAFELSGRTAMAGQLNLLSWQLRLRDALYVQSVS